jgi:methionyl-tRNA formyltransferase
VRLLLAGTPSVSVPIFEAVVSSELDVIGVITNPPRAQGRSVTPVPSPVSQWAHAHSLKVFESGTSEEYIPALHSADIVLVVAYGQLIPQVLLDIPKHGWVNIHFSHLPEARGAAPVQRLIQSGAQSIGFTLFQMESGMDTGPIFYKSDPIPISGLTTGEVWEELAEQASGSIVKLLNDIDEGVKPTPQERYLGPLPLAPKIASEEARINWDTTDVEVINHVLALNPTACAWTSFRGERFIIHRARKSSHTFSEENYYGAIYHERESVHVSCGQGAVELLEVQPAGKKKIAASDWLRGAQLTPGEKFE